MPRVKDSGRGYPSAPRRSQRIKERKDGQAKGPGTEERGESETNMPITRSHENRKKRKNDRRGNESVAQGNTLESKDGHEPSGTKAREGSGASVVGDSSTAKRNEKLRRRNERSHPTATKPTTRGDTGSLPKHLYLDNNNGMAVTSKEPKDRPETTTSSGITASPLPRNGSLFPPTGTSRSSSIPDDDVVDNNGYEENKKMPTSAEIAALRRAQVVDESVSAQEELENGDIGQQLEGDDDTPPLADTAGSEDSLATMHSVPTQTESEKGDPWTLLDPQDVGTTRPEALEVGVTYCLPEGLTVTPFHAVTESLIHGQTFPIGKLVEPSAPPIVSIAVKTFKATVENRRHQHLMARTIRHEKDSTDGAFRTVVAPPRLPLEGLAFGDEFAYIAEANTKRKAAEHIERRLLEGESSGDYDDDIVVSDQFDDDDYGGGCSADIAPLDEHVEASPDATDLDEHVQASPDATDETLSMDAIDDGSPHESASTSADYSCQPPFQHNGHAEGNDVKFEDSSSSEDDHMLENHNQTESRSVLIPGSAEINANRGSRPSFTVTNTAGYRSRSDDGSTTPLQEVKSRRAATPFCPNSGRDCETNSFKALSSTMDEEVYNDEFPREGQRLFAGTPYRQSATEESSQESIRSILSPDDHPDANEANPNANEANPDANEVVEPEGLSSLNTRFSGLSVDVDEPAAKNPEPVNLGADDRTRVDIEFPPGRLGLRVIQADPTWIKVAHVDPKCALYGYVQEGDLIDYVGSWPARGKTIADLVEELRRTTHQKRRIVRVRRAVTGTTVNDEHHQGIERGGGRGRGRGARGGRGRGRGRGVRGGSGGGRDRGARRRNGQGGASQEAPIPSRYTTSGRATIHSSTGGEGTEEPPPADPNDQKVGTNATKMAHFRGRGAEYQKSSMYDHHFMHSMMVTPAVVIEGKATADWPRIRTVHITIDPFRASNSKGGRRPLSLKKNLRDKPLVTVAVQGCLGDITPIIQSLSGSNWSSNSSYDVCVAHDTESAMLGDGPSRKRSLDAEPQNPTRKVSAKDTPAPKQRSKSRENRDGLSRQVGAAHQRQGQQQARRREIIRGRTRPTANGPTLQRRPVESALRPSKYSASYTTTLDRRSGSSQLNHQGRLPSTRATTATDTLVSQHRSAVPQHEQCHHRQTQTGQAQERRRQVTAADTPP